MSTNELVEQLAVADLGSNSFRLQIARVMDDQFYTIDTVKGTVRLGAGLTRDQYLNEDTQERALQCLAKFGERLRGLPAENVRIVGTNTLRVSRNAAEFMAKAEALLGFPIEIIAGREEARLIYLGAAHSLPHSNAPRLVVDIGGGSTEFIIGRAYEAEQTESLTMGCVSYSMRFFEEGKWQKSAFRQAELTAQSKLQKIADEFAAQNWQQAIATSGTARALRDILEQNGYSESGITLEGMERLKSELLRVGSWKHIDLAGLRADRVPVLAGGLAIMMAIFRSLGVKNMQVTNGALREGVLYDMIGRQHQQDLREVTVAQFQKRYHVDVAQAARVAKWAKQYALLLSNGMRTELGGLKYLTWAAHLHEIGLSISHSSYHKHSAYILDNADMPGFSNREQNRLALWVLAHKGSLTKLPSNLTQEDWRMIFALRLAVVMARARRDEVAPEALGLRFDGRGFLLELPETWLEQNPLTESALLQEVQYWKNAGLSVQIQTWREE